MNVWVLQFAYTAPSASGYLLLAWSLFTSGWWWTNKRHNYSLPSSCSLPHLSSIIYHHGDYICTTITFAPIQSLCSLCVGFATLVRFPNCRVPKASGLGNPTRALLVRFPNCRVPEASGLGNLTRALLASPAHLVWASHANQDGGEEKDKNTCNSGQSSHHLLLLHFNAYICVFVSACAGACVFECIMSVFLSVNNLTPSAFILSCSKISTYCNA